VRGGEDNPAQEEFNGLLAHLLPFAQQTLRRYGTFYPFAATMTASGAIAAVAVQVPDEQPTSTAVIAALREALTTETRGGAITAVGICADVRLTSPDGSEARDAISVQLESRAGIAIEVCVPYRRGWLGRFTYDRPVTVNREGTIFGT
jgi:hypothetical protein